MSALTERQAGYAAELTRDANRMIAVFAFIAVNAVLFPDGIYAYGHEFSAGYWGENAKENLAQAIRTVRRHFVGSEVRKDYSGGNFSATIQLPNSPIYFTLFTARANVCTKVDTGQTVKKTVPDYANAPTKEIDEPVVEWICDPLLAD